MCTERITILEEQIRESQIMAPSVALTFLLCCGMGCGNSADDNGNSNSALYQFSRLYCAWNSHCSDGSSVSYCLERYFNDDTWHENPLAMVGGLFAPSIDCLNQVTNCADLQACVPGKPCAEEASGTSCQQDGLTICYEGIILLVLVVKPFIGMYDRLSVFL